MAEYTPLRPDLPQHPHRAGVDREVVRCKWSVCAVWYERDVWPWPGECPEHTRKTADAYRRQADEWRSEGVPEDEIRRRFL